MPAKLWSVLVSFTYIIIAKKSCFIVVYRHYKFVHGTSYGRLIALAGKNVAVFRGEDGRAHALDAYCCHNGANLAAGGLVKGSCLECPFHGWQFRGDDGKCTHVPYCDRTASMLSFLLFSVYVRCYWRRQDLLRGN